MFVLIYLERAMEKKSTKIWDIHEVTNLYGITFFWKLSSIFGKTKIAEAHKIVGL